MPIFWLKSKRSWIFFLLFLSSNIAPWVQAEWTNMCLNLVMQKIKIMNLFCLPEYSILIGHYETTGLRSIFTLLSPMWTIHFTLVLIQFICVACLLVCKYTNQKKVDLCTNSDWSLIYSGKKNIAFWLVDLMQPFFRAWWDFTASQRWFLKQQFCLTDLKVRFWYATMNAWIQIWVQGEMCGNNTIKLEWHIYNVSISP